MRGPVWSAGWRRMAATTGRMSWSERRGKGPSVARPAAVDALAAAVGELAVEAEVRHADAVAPVRAPAGERARHLAHVALGVAASRAEREQLLQLARVVLVRLVAGVVD